MTMLAIAPPRIAVLSFDLRCATPAPSILIGRSGSSPLQSLPNKAFNAPWQHTASTAIPIASDAFFERNRLARRIRRRHQIARLLDQSVGAPVSRQRRDCRDVVVMGGIIPMRQHDA
jgi:hypothetical protein